jgi:hypothetical protein
MCFDDIAGNEYAKEIINETFVLPNIMPHLFKGNARPWQSILIYGVSLSYSKYNINIAPGGGENNACLSCISSLKSKMYMGILGRYYI